MFTYMTQQRNTDQLREMAVVFIGAGLGYTTRSEGNACHSVSRKHCMALFRSRWCLPREPRCAVRSGVHYGRIWGTEL